MNTLAHLRTRAAQALFQQSSSAREEWIHQAQPWLELTASAIMEVTHYDLDSTLQPAMTLDVFDATCTELWAPEERVKQSSKAQADAVARKSGRRPIAGKGENERNIWGVADAARALRKRDISPLELLEASIAQIETTEHEVHAWECVTRDAARAAARHLKLPPTENGAMELLFGIPYGAKDNVLTKDVPTTGSSALYRGFVPTRNAEIVDTLDVQSAILLGKTTATEMALGDSPRTRNPWNLGHTPGGSSAGSAAAVAANHVPFAIASQTGGSINRPASYCGLVAVKPTWGRISRQGVLPLAWTLDHLGVMTRTVEDQAWVFDAICGTSFRHLVKSRSSSRRAAEPASRSTSESKGALRIGRPDRYFLGPSLHPAQRQAFEEMLRELQGAGLRVIDVELPSSFEVAVDAHALIMQCEVAAAYGLRSPKDMKLLRPTLRSRILAGLATPAPIYLRAQQIRRAYIEQMSALFECIDLLATPSTPTPADKGIEYSGSAAFNSSFSMAGFPTVVFPTGVDEQTGCPLSAQFIARPYGESQLFDAAFEYERSTAGAALLKVYGG